jgi:hypothetical protein
LEQRRRAACPAKGVARNANQGSKDIAHSLLAHAAMADMRAVEHGIRTIAHRAALASTRDDDRYCIHALTLPYFVSGAIYIANVGGSPLL